MHKRIIMNIYSNIKKACDKFRIRLGLYENEYLLTMNQLITDGLKIGKNVTIETAVYIDNVYPYLISIGDNCSIASGVRLLAHDDTPCKFTGGYARLGRIDIKDNCFIGENCIILPGVSIGPNVLIAAGSVVNKDILPNSCVAGVPARFYAKFDEYIENQKKLIQGAYIFDYYDLHEGINEDIKNKVTTEIQRGRCYVRGKRGQKYSFINWNTP